MSELLSAAQILDAEDLKHEDVSIPEWGGVVRVREMSAAEAMDFAQDTTNPNEGIFVMIALTVCDLEGNRLFSLEDVPALKKKNLRVLRRLQEAVNRVNGSSKDAEVALKKDSSEAATAASPTA